MIKNKKEKYCYLTPNYPKEAFMVVAFFTTERIPLMIAPLSNVSTNIDEAIETIKEFVEEWKYTEIKDADFDPKVVEIGVLMPITFQKLFPLKKEYWTKKIKDPDLQNKSLAFLPVINNPHFYKLLVTPFGHIKKDWGFCAAYPFSMFSEDAEIEKFMYESDQQVDIKAKYAAIYSFGILKRLNWKTGEISDIEKNKLKKPKIVN